MAMDMLRASNQTQARMLSVGNRKFWVRWYRCAPGAKAFPGLHAFQSGFWHDSPKDAFEGPGVFSRPLRWVPSAYPAPPGLHYHGPLEWFRNGIPPEMLGTGDPHRICAMPIHEMSGGGEAGNAAEVTSTQDAVPAPLLVSVTDDPDEFLVDNPAPVAVNYYIYNESSQTFITYTYLCVDGVCGWFNSCDCSWLPQRWYCTPEGCLIGTSPPADVVSGPYDTSEECVVACNALRYWCVFSDPTYSCVPALSSPVGAVSGPYDTSDECAAVCGLPYWCVDVTPPVPYWCVSVPDSAPDGTCDCEACPDGSPLAWALPVPSAGPGRLAGLAGDWVISWDASVARDPGVCLWGSSPLASPSFPRWRLVRVSGHWVLWGEISQGGGIRFNGPAVFDCCGLNVFTFAATIGGFSGSHSWTGPTTLTITPIGDCDCEGTPASECVQQSTTPPGVTSGPYDTPEECAAGCDGGGIVVGCWPAPVSPTLTGTLSAGSGELACFGGLTFPLTYSSGTSTWTGDPHACGLLFTSFTIQCADPDWVGAFPLSSQHGAPITWTGPVVGPGPSLSLVWVGTTSVPFAGSVILTVTG